MRSRRTLQHTKQQKKKQKKKSAISSSAPLLVSFALFFILFIISFFSLPHIFSTRAIDPIDDIQNQINQIAHLRDLSIQATTPLENQVKDLRSRIQKAQADIKAAQDQTQHLSQTISDHELQLASQYKIFSARVAARYERTSTGSPLLELFSSNDAVSLTRILAYRAAVEDRDNQLIHQTGQQIFDLENQKKDVQARQQRLASLSQDLNKQVDSFNKTIAGAQAYQAQLSDQIAALTAKQQEILNARSGSFTTSVGDVPPADDFNASIAFKPQAPNNSFAVFSFGAHSNRNGMSQYGAAAQADNGKSAEDILHSYYPDAQIRKGYPETGDISVRGYGRMSFEDRYMQGIMEMPRTWNYQALKAQAIVARTYALRRTNNGQTSICTDQSCQVFYNSIKGGDWQRAVNDTKGWVLVDGSGNLAGAQYNSTDGGYSNTGGWDTTDKNGGGDWASRAWETKVHSPWFYKAWYTQGYSVESAKCGRNHPWLSQQEFSDIINAWIVRKNPNGADTNRIVPVTINQCNVGGGGGNPYSMDELRNLANNSGGAVTQIHSVTVSNNNNGTTTNVHFETNRGGIDIPGVEFKSTFNLRAPGFLSIPQRSYTFFNIEYKP